MPVRRSDDPPGDMTAILDWWREAGVDCAFADTPRRWIAAPDRAEAPDGAPAPVGPAPFAAIEAPPVATAVAPPAPTGGDRAGWPTTLGEFADWWLREPALDNGQVRGRVPPRGPEAAPLMILVGEPEAEDGAVLLSGPHGRLLAGMLAAMGLRESDVYVASALPRHTPMADWRDLAAKGLGEVVRMHVTLARPRRVIAFGRHLPPLLVPEKFEPPLPDNAPPQTGAMLAQFTHEQAGMKLLTARDLGSLLERPAAKGPFWQHWLEWTAG